METYRIPAGLEMGPVHLIVHDRERTLHFYRDVLGLAAETTGDVTMLHAGTRPLFVLTERPDAPTRPSRAPGLYHTAILTPSRGALGRTLRRLMESGYPVGGASDHGVSEALYMDDPEGNGIEIYRDRPREEWPRNGEELAMVTQRLDAEGVLRAGDEDGGHWAGLPDGTCIGHVHLKVSRIPETEAFYREALGLDLVQRYGPSASFLSAGGYHHHVGMNTWESAGGTPVPAGTAGLAYMTLRLPDAAELARLAAHLDQTGIPTEPVDGGFLVHDPAGNGVLVMAQ